MAANSRGVTELNDLIDRLDGLILVLASATGEILTYIALFCIYNILKRYLHSTIWKLNNNKFSQLKRKTMRWDVVIFLCTISVTSHHFLLTVENRIPGNVNIPFEPRTDFNQPTIDNY